MERILEVVSLSPVHICHRPSQSIKKIGILIQEGFPYHFDLVWRKKKRKTFHMQDI